MNTYISILRGINVGGLRIIRMGDLKSLYEKLGFRSVQTYIQSGNVVFQSERPQTDEIAKMIEAGIKGSFGFDVPVVVIERTELTVIVSENPFLKDGTADISQLHVTFFAEAPEPGLFEQFFSLTTPGELFHAGKKVLYLYCPNGYGKIRLTNGFLETKLGVTATTRNWRTTGELANMAQSVNNSGQY